MNKIICGDCLEVMKEIPDNTIDLILTSPPYEDVKSAGYGVKTKDVLFLKLYSEFWDKFLKEYKRIIKDTGQIFINMKSKTMDKMIMTPHWIEFTEGFQQLKFKSYIIWKYAGSFDSTNKRMHLDYEIIYHLSKGDNIYLNQEGIDPLTSVWYIPHNIPKKDRKHPTQMPIKLAERIINLASRKGETVLDTFNGVGTTTMACKKSGRNFIGIEINPEYCKIANQFLTTLSN